MIPSATLTGCTELRPKSRDFGTNEIAGNWRRAVADRHVRSHRCFGTVISDKLSQMGEPVVPPCVVGPESDDEWQRAECGPPPRRRRKVFIDNLLAWRPVTDRRQPFI